MGNRYQYLFAFVCVLLLFGCSGKPRVPSQFPDEEEMAQILAEVHFAESVMLNSRKAELRTDSMKAGYYKSILEKYSISKEMMDSAVKWYSNYPQLYDEVYEDVISILSAQEATMKNRITKEEEEEAALRELLDPKTVWKSKAILGSSSKVLNDSLFFIDLKLDTIKVGTLMFSALYKYKDVDSSYVGQAMFIALYKDSVRDTISIEIENTPSKRSMVEYSYVMREDTSLISLYGTLFIKDSLASKVDLLKASIEFVPQLTEAQRADSIRVLGAKKK